MSKAHLAGLGLFITVSSFAAEGPLYKPSSRSPEPIDISTNTYGASSLAPSALNLSDVAPDFTLPQSGGGTYKLSKANKPVAIVFYRGHW